MFKYNKKTVFVGIFSLHEISLISNPSVTKHILQVAVSKILLKYIVKMY